MLGAKAEDHPPLALGEEVRHLEGALPPCWAQSCNAPLQKEWPKKQSFETSWELVCRLRKSISPPIRKIISDLFWSLLKAWIGLGAFPALSHVLQWENHYFYHPLFREIIKTQWVTCSGLAHPWVNQGSLTCEIRVSPKVVQCCTEHSNNPASCLTF